MKKPIIADSILVSRYISGHEKSLEILINRHKQRIYSFIYSKVYDRDLTASELLQNYNAQRSRFGV